MTFILFRVRINNDQNAGIQSPESSPSIEIEHIDFILTYQY